MKDILLKRNRPILERFLHKRSILVFDFDGTLAPLVRRPEIAQLSPAMRKALVALAHLRPTAVVTGRSLKSIGPKVEGVPLVGLVGNHGMEWDPPIHKFTKQRCEVEAWAKLLTTVLAPVAGIEIENKVFTLSVHYRLCQDYRAAREAIRRALRGLGRHRAIGGKEVFNVVPVGMPDKGDAVHLLMKKFKASHAVFFGDDVTDEDVFRRANPKILSIHIGRQRKTAAPYGVGSLAEMEKLLVQMREIVLQMDEKVPVKTQSSRPRSPTKLKRLTKS